MPKVKWRGGKRRLVAEGYGPVNPKAYVMRAVDRVKRAESREPRRMTPEERESCKRGKNRAEPRMRKNEIEMKEAISRIE